MKKTVKLQKRFTTNDGGRKYAVYQIQLPRSMVERLGWKKGDVLELRLRLGVDAHTISIRRARHV